MNNFLSDEKESYDGALPSGNSVAALQLLRLAKLTGEYTFEEKVQQIFDTFAGDIAEYPNGHTMMLQAILLSRQTLKEIVIIYDKDNHKLKKIIHSIQQNYHPHLHLLVGESLMKLCLLLVNIKRLMVYQRYTFVKFPMPSTDK